MNTIGNTGLWAMSAGGVVIGGALISLGSYKIHKIRNRYWQFFKEKNFETLGRSKSDFCSLYKKHYYIQDIGENCTIVIRVGTQKDLKCTPSVPKAEKGTLTAFLQEEGYQLQTEPLTEKQQTLQGYFSQDFSKLNKKKFALLADGDHIIVSKSRETTSAIVRNHNGVLECTDFLSAVESQKVLKLLILR